MSSVMKTLCQVWLRHCVAGHSEAGGNAVANAYSIVETAKANDLDVLKYLEYILRRLPTAEGNFTDEFLEKLAPWNPDVQEVCQRGHF